MVVGAANALPERQLKPRRVISAIYNGPFFTTDFFKIDWLHNMDLGVSCDAIGNCLLAFALQLPRKSNQPSGCRIPENPRFLCQEWEPTQSPKLKTTRVLVPWACEMC